MRMSRIHIRYLYASGLWAASVTHTLPGTPVVIGEIEKCRGQFCHVTYVTFVGSTMNNDMQH